MRKNKSADEAAAQAAQKEEEERKAAERRAVAAEVAVANQEFDRAVARVVFAEGEGHPTVSEVLAAVASRFPQLVVLGRQTVGSSVLDLRGFEVRARCADPEVLARNHHLDPIKGQAAPAVADLRSFIDAAVFTLKKVKDLRAENERLRKALEEDDPRDRPPMVFRRRGPWGPWGPW